VTTRQDRPWTPAEGDYMPFGATSVACGASTGVSPFGVRRLSGAARCCITHVYDSEFAIRVAAVSVTTSRIACVAIAIGC
jgi:hypothetical protein